MIFYAFIFALGVFLASISQVLLKKAAQKSYGSTLQEYMNPLVIFAYTVFVLTTLMTIYSYRGIPLSLGAVLETTSYIYVTIFGVVIFHEKVGKKKLLALALIIAGIVIYAIGF